MGFLYRRHDSSLWWVCWTDPSGERHRESTGQADLEAARQVLEDLERRLAARRNLPQAEQQAAAADVDRRLSNHLTRAELERLIFDPRVERFRRCQWAALALTGARIGEVLGLRVRHFDSQRRPLARLLVTGRWDSKQRRLTPSLSGLPREVPAHRVLAAMLLEHIREVLPARLGRAVGPDDLLFPAPGGDPQQAGTVLSHLQRDLEVVGLRRGNLHTLRRTFFAMGRQGGAFLKVLRLIAEEGRPGDPDVPYAAKCAEIARLDVSRERTGGGPLMPPDPFPGEAPPPPPPQMSTGR